MPSFTGTALTALKLSGTAALGVLTGAHLTFSLSTLQHLGTRSSISTALEYHRNHVTLPLTLYGTSALVLTYLLSSPRGRHPYLIMASIMPIVGFGVSMGVFKKHPQVEGSRRKQKSPSPPPSVNMAASTSEDEFEKISRSVLYDKNRPSPSPGERTPTSAQEAEEEEGGVAGLPMGYDGTADEQVEVYRFANLLNAVVTGLGFAIGLVGNWGEGYYIYY